MKFSKDKVVRFDPATHTYWRGEERLMGVTSFIKKFVEPFDAPMQAERYALKHGLIASEVLAEWELKGLKARTEGTAIHLVLENYCETGRINWEQGNMKQIVAVKFIKDYFMSGKLTPVAWEEIVYGDKLATQIDLIAANQKGEYFGFDYKSSKEISKNGYKRYMLTPFDEHPDSNFFHYSLQMSIGRQLCKSYDLKENFIIHINENDYEIIQAKNIMVPKHLL